MSQHKEGEIVEDGHEESEAFVVVAVDQQVRHVVLDLCDVVGQFLVQGTVVSVVLKLVLACVQQKLFFGDWRKLSKGGHAGWNEQNHALLVVLS